MPGLQHAGHQQDLNYVYGLLGELSDQLRQNREQTDNLVNGVRRIHQHAAAAGTLPTVEEASAELNSGAEGNLAARVAELEGDLAKLVRERDAALKDAEEWQDINQIYQTTLNDNVTKIRNFIYHQKMETIALHKHYSDLVQKERDINLEIRLEHSRWQEALGRVAENSRQALRHISEYNEPFEIERAELRHQNKYLRRRLGWEADPDDSPDDEEEATGEKAEEITGE